MNTAIAAFTNRGIALALKVADFLGEGTEVFVPARFSREGVGVISPSLTEWTGRVFHEAGALIFVGACGIAVRAVAQHAASKR